MKTSADRRYRLRRRIRTRTFKTGWAAYEAAQDIKRQMRERAARVWECDLEEVTYQSGGLTHATDADKTLTFTQVAARQNAGLENTGHDVAFSLRGSSTISPSPDRCQAPSLRCMSLGQIGWIAGQHDGGLP